MVPSPEGARSPKRQRMSEAGPPEFMLRFTLQGHKKSISSLAFSPDGTLLASASADLPIHIHGLPTFNLQRTLNSHTQGVSHIAFSADSAFLASASDDKTVRIWELDGGGAALDNDAGGDDLHRSEESVRVLRGHLSAVFCVAWNPRGDLVASGGMDETVRVWDVQKGKCMRVLPAHSEPVSAVQFNRDGTIIVSGSWDGYMSHAFFSPNSKFVFASTLDSTVRLWDYQNDKTIKTYIGHTNRKHCIPAALTANGRYLIAGSEDHKFFVWDLQTRKIIQQAESHKDVVMAVACHPQLGILATAGLEKVRSFPHN
ncbi:hypothetical protein RQP46_008964 [Phenoliferia psychrophenolica]